MIPWRYSTRRSPFSWCPSRNVRSYANAYADTSFVDVLVRSTTADRLSGARRTALTSTPMVTVCAFARADEQHRTIATDANKTSFDDWLIVHFLITASVQTRVRRAISLKTLELVRKLYGIKPGCVANQTRQPGRIPECSERNRDRRTRRLRVSMLKSSAPSRSEDRILLGATMIVCIKIEKGPPQQTAPVELCLFACQEHVVSFGADVRSS